jgi:hypothetical protein
LYIFTFFLFFVTFFYLLLRSPTPYLYQFVASAYSPLLAAYHTPYSCSRLHLCMMDSPSSLPSSSSAAAAAEVVVAVAEAPPNEEDIRRELGEVKRDLKRLELQLNDSGAAGSHPPSSANTDAGVAGQRRHPFDSRYASKNFHTPIDPHAHGIGLHACMHAMRVSRHRIPAYLQTQSPSRIV